jgi:uncharacterized protein (UPF0297 family)
MALKLKRKTEAPQQSRAAAKLSRLSTPDVMLVFEQATMASGQIVGRLLSGDDNYRHLKDMRTQIELMEGCLEVLEHRY